MSHNDTHIVYGKTHTSTVTTSDGFYCYTLVTAGSVTFSTPLRAQRIILLIEHF